MIGRVQLVDTELGPVGVPGHVDEEITEQPVDQPGGEFTRGGDLIRTWDWPAVLGGSRYLWAGALEVTRVAGFVKAAGRG